ncbi:cyclase family protein [Actinomycetaceae bacterium L2_0104]
MGEWLDLTKPLDQSIEIYGEEGYRDPDFHTAPWVGHAAQGFEVWQLSLGTQTGTHIDAPRHFDPAGATIDALSPDDCVGAYRLLRSGELGRCAEYEWTATTAVVVDTRSEAPMAPEAIEILVECSPSLVVLIGEVLVAHRDPLLFHRKLAQAGKFLLEDTRCDIGTIPREGRIVALPLRLVGLSGSPARLLLGKTVPDN